MFSVILLNFDKKENSTKQPTSGGLAVQGVLKEPCSIMNPVIKIERLANDAVPSTYTYAYIAKFSRYYFIEDWVWQDGLWEVHMKEDVLASFKTQIGLQTEYVLRTDNTTFYNGDITDTTYPATTDVISSVVENANPFSPDSIDSGCYIVGMISSKTNYAVGAITYYAMSSAQFGDLKHILFSDDNLEIMGILDMSTTPPTQLVTDLSPEVLKTIYNPYQYIASCVWIPVALNDIVNKESVSYVYMGWWEYPISCYVLTATTLVVTETDISLPDHPQSSSRGAYLNYAPYTKRSIFGKFGAIPLDCAMFKSGDSIRISYKIDLITGLVRTMFMRVRTLSVDLFMQKDFEIGVPIQIAQIGTDYLGTVATAISTVATTAQQAVSLNVGGAIATAATGIYNTIQTAMPQLETSGSNGSFLQASNMTKMLTMFYKIVDEDLAHRGRPLCELHQLNTLSGFILCAEGEIDISCFDNERKEIVKFLTTGFFWE